MAEGKLIRPALWTAAGVVMAALSTATVVAQSPTGSPTGPPATAPSGPPPGAPTGPPSEAVNCIRPTVARTNSRLAAAGDPVLHLDTTTGKVSLTIPQPPSGATCYAIYRTPSGTNPISFAWDAKGVVVPSSIVDDVPFASAGRYCYQLLFGDSQSATPASEQCIDIPTSIAPAPEPTPTIAKLPPFFAGAPDRGQGPAANEGVAIPWPALGAGAVLAALGIAGVLAARSRRR